LYSDKLGNQCIASANLQISQCWLAGVEPLAIVMLPE